MTTENRVIADKIATLIDEYKLAPESDHKVWVDRIIRLLFPHFKNWAPTFCRLSGDVYGNHKDDVVIVVAERTLKVLYEVLIPGKHENVANWYSYLNGIGRYAALAYFNSAEVTAASGMVAMQRKQRHIARTREALRSRLGREPLPQEIIDEANAQMRMRRSDPEKQGALVDHADLNVVLSAADIADHDREADDSDAAVLSPVEGRELIQVIIEACFEQSKTLGDVAVLWVGSAYAEPPALGTANEIAKSLHIGQSKAAQLLDEARETAQQACLERFGITFPG